MAAIAAPVHRRVMIDPSAQSAGLELPLGGAPVRLAPHDFVRLVREATGAGGALWVQVTGHSMSPVIRHGDSVLITGLVARPRVGEVVLLERNGGPLLHRVVRVTGETITTRGDALRSADDTHSATALIGQAMMVLKGGKLVTLTPTLAFGPAALWRGAMWRIRGRLAALRRGVRTGRSVG